MLSLQSSQVPSHTCGSQCQPQFTGVHCPRGIFIELVKCGLEDGEAGWSQYHKSSPRVMFSHLEVAKRGPLRPNRLASSHSSPGFWVGTTLYLYL